MNLMYINEILKQQQFLRQAVVTDLCVLKVVVYRILQLPQFLLFFFLFLFLLFGQSSLSLFVIIVL